MSFFVHATEVPFTRKWIKLPGLQKRQVDTGLTSALWGVSPAGQPMVYLNETWVPVSGVFKDISSGEAGVWAVKGDGQVFYRAGVSHLNPTGMRWKNVGGYLRQVDSGSKGVVYGIDQERKLVCRGGIQKDLPTGLKWKNIEGAYKHVTCGYRGCWVIRDDNRIQFRLGITDDNCEGRVWVNVNAPKQMRYIENGGDGTLWAVDENAEVWYREAVDALHPYGTDWAKLNLGGAFRMITSGFDGQYALDISGYVYHLEGKCLNELANFTNYLKEMLFSLDPFSTFPKTH
jgi:hypothetical protein